MVGDAFGFISKRAMGCQGCLLSGSGRAQQCRLGSSTGCGIKRRSAPRDGAAQPAGRCTAVVACMWWRYMLGWLSPWGLWLGTWVWPLLCKRTVVRALAFAFLVRMHVLFGDSVAGLKMFTLNTCTVAQCCGFRALRCRIGELLCWPSLLVRVSHCGQGVHLNQRL